jgi:hypothetical protein
LNTQDPTFALRGVFWRPVLQLRSLSLRMRWEVTRRHTSYLVFWNGQPPASMQGPESAKELFAENLASIKRIALGAIGVSGKTFDPTIEFKDLSKARIETEWLSGAVHPVSMRGLASLLVSSLPKDALQKIGMAIIEAGLDEESGKAPRKIQSLAKIASYDNPELDAFTMEPFVSINPDASGRQVQPEIMSLLKRWKSQYQLPETRDKSKSELACLDVWDRREGWQNGSYSLSREQLFREIAGQLSRPLTTVHAQYKRAFELISGHKYSVQNWLDLFGPIKLSSLYERDSDAGLSRNLVEKSTQDVPETRLGQNAKCDEGIVGLNSIAAKEDHSDFERLSDLKEMFSAGKTNAQICVVLNVKKTKERLSALNAIKDRIQDGSLSE